MSRVVLEAIRYLTSGGLSITLCGGLLRLLALKIRTSFNRHVVDRALEQGQPIDPAEIIHAATLRTYGRPAEPHSSSHVGQLKPQARESTAVRAIGGRREFAELSKRLASTWHRKYPGH